MKTCSKCKQTKGRSEFYRDRANADGLHSQCKACHKETEYKYNRTVAGRERHRRYNREPKNIEKNKLRKRARRKMRGNDIPSAQKLYCVYCGERADSYHHWMGYDRQYTLVFFPVCNSCHGLENCGPYLNDNLKELVIDLVKS